MLAWWTCSSTLSNDVHKTLLAGVIRVLRLDPDHRNATDNLSLPLQAACETAAADVGACFDPAPTRCSLWVRRRHLQPTATGRSREGFWVPPSRRSPRPPDSASSSSYPSSSVIYGTHYHSCPNLPQIYSTTASSRRRSARTQFPAENVRQTIIDRVFNRTSPWEGFPPKHVISDGLILEEWTKGWGSNMPVFEHLIEKARPKTIIEVGTFLGASAIHMVGLTRKLGLDSQILCIDDFRGWPGYYDEGKGMKMVNGDVMMLYQFMQNVVRANASDSIMFLPFSTNTALGGLCDWGVYGDLVEVDAAHDFHSAWVDINNAYKVLKKPGGILFGHDIVWVGVRKAVEIFARLHGSKLPSTVSTGFFTDIFLSIFDLL
ncbi:uncharacterized protein [Henckelia pumila]|uniref:uncharacterized protein n=1 Tax=Henckelia pumila TaxID=405737 RepID=UPI003C6E6722